MANNGSMLDYSLQYHPALPTGHTHACMNKSELQSPLWPSSCHAHTNATIQLLLLRQGPVKLLGTNDFWYNQLPQRLLQPSWAELQQLLLQCLASYDDRLHLQCHC